MPSNVFIGDEHQIYIAKNVDYIQIIFRSSKLYAYFINMSLLSSNGTHRSQAHWQTSKCKNILRSSLHGFSETLSIMAQLISASFYWQHLFNVEVKLT